MDQTDSDTADQIAKRLALAKSRGDHVEWWMTNPKRPLAVHLKENVEAGDFTNPIRFEDYQ